MQVQVHHVHAKITGTSPADQRIHVGPIHVEQGALGVENVGNLMNLALEDADGAGVGQHQCSGVFGDHLLQLADVDHAQRVGAQILHLVAADGRGRRVGSVSRVGDDDLAPRISPGLMIGADQQDAGELPVRARRRLQRYGVHSGDVEQAGLQQANDLERSLGKRLGLVRMRFGDALKARDEFVDPRVVLHGAAAQRVHAQIDGIVPGGEAGEVADDLDLAQLGHNAQVRAGSFAQQAFRIHFGHIQRGHLVGLFARRRLLKDQGLVLRKVPAHFVARAFKRMAARLACFMFPRGCHKSMPFKPALGPLRIHAAAARRCDRSAPAC